ncbi:MAG: ABC transporter substrate-binding protein [Chloroflexi bacterium]|nr:ABC transporter substrate-binding protein [Chloroflexota bacterium]
MRRILFVTAAAAALAALTACGPAPAPPSAGPAPAGGGGAVPAATAAAQPGAAAPQAKKSLTPADQRGPVSGGTLNYWIYDWPHLDPHQTLTAGFHGNVGLIYGSLLQFAYGNDIQTPQIIPSSVEKWTNPDEKTYIMNLHQGIKWHNLPPVNGREFTADDVVYSINRIKTPGWISAPLMADVDKVEAVDKYTVKFTLKGASAPFLSYVANGYIKMVAQEAVEAGQNKELKNGPNIGTGPFELVEAIPKVSVKLKKFDGYWEKDAKGVQLPYLAMVNGINLPDSSVRFTALRTAKLDYYTCDPEECEILKKASPEVTMLSVPSWSAQQIGMKVNKKPFDDVRVRKAMSLAIDRKSFHSTVYSRPFEQGTYHFAFVVPDISWVAPQAEFEKAWAYNVDEAKKLLADAGYPNGFDTTLTCANYDTRHISACEFLVSAWKSIGVKATIKVVDPPTYSSSVFAGEGNFETYYGPQGLFMEPDQWLSGYYYSTGPRNVNKINDPKLDKLIDDQRKELNPEKRKAIVLEIQRYLMDQYYHLHPRAITTNTAIWPWVGGYTPFQDYPTVRSIHYMWTDDGARKK